MATLLSLFQLQYNEQITNPRMRWKRFNQVNTGHFVLLSGVQRWRQTGPSTASLNPCPATREADEGKYSTKNPNGVKIKVKDYTEIYLMKLKHTHNVLPDLQFD